MRTRDEGDIPDPRERRSGSPEESRPQPLPEPPAEDVESGRPGRGESRSEDVEGRGRPGAAEESVEGGRPLPEESGSPVEEPPSPGRARRGFAAMDPAAQREIARRGGEASHQRGRAHEWSPEEARQYGREGGRASHQSGHGHEWTSEEAREAGRRGGALGSSSRKRRERRERRKGA